LTSQYVPIDDSDPPEGVLAPILKDRETMGHWASKMIDKNELQNYQAKWNAESLDGLPGLSVARRDRGQRLWVTGLKARAKRVLGQREGLAWGLLWGALVMWMWRVFVEVLSR